MIVPSSVARLDFHHVRDFLVLTYDRLVLRERVIPSFSLVFLFVGEGFQMEVKKDIASD